MVDMWWLAGALFLVCIIEVCERLQFFSAISLTHTQRGNIMNPDNQSWFTIFNISKLCFWRCYLHIAYYGMQYLN